MTKIGLNPEKKETGILYVFDLSSMLFENQIKQRLAIHTYAVSRLIVEDRLLSQT